MIKMPLSVIQVAVLCLPLALVTSCGSDGAEGVQNSIVNFDPSGIGQATTAGTAGRNSNIFRAEVRSPTGYPQIGVRITIDSQYTVYAGRPTVDCSSNPCTASGATPVSLPYTTTTGPNGTVEVTVVYSWGTSIKGDFTAVEAFSGTGYGNAIITYTCTDPNAAGTAPDCPT